MNGRSRTSKLAAYGATSGRVPMVQRQVIGGDGPSLDPRQGAGGEIKVVDQLPDVQVYPFGFHAIPAWPNSLTAPITSCYWYGLQSIRVRKDSGGELALISISGSMVPTNLNGYGYGLSQGSVTPARWGGPNGEGAALLVGIDLPVKRGEWTVSDCYLPGINPGIATGDANTASPGVPRKPQYLWHTKFPAGSLPLSGSTERTFIGFSFAPMLRRIPDGSRLDAALVLAAASSTAVTENQHIVGNACFQMQTAPPFAEAVFDTR